jgi:hypothetical protein
MLAGIISGVQTLLGRLTSTRAGYLDKLNITGNVPSATYYTNTLGTTLSTNVNATITSRAAASTALDNTVWTSAHATKLAALRPIPQIKVQASGISASAVSGGATSSARYFYYADSVVALSSNMAVDADYKFGLRWAESNALTLTDVVNVSAAGWIMGIALLNTTSTYNGQTILTVDGTVILDTTLASLTTGQSKLLVGRYYYVSAGLIPLLLSQYPIRFDSSLRVQHQGSNAAVYTEVVYLLD